MSRAKKKPKKTAKRRRYLLPLILVSALIAVALAAVLALHVNASIVHLTFDEVYLADLPAAFDGKTALFITDIHLLGVNTPERAARLMRSLESLMPDILLLGGDYASESALELTQENNVASDIATRRRSFFSLIKDFEAPMGKYAVAGNHDAGYPGLQEALEQNGITFLQNEAVKISRDGESLIIAGLDDFNTGTRRLAALAGMVKSNDCVIVLTHTPDALPAIATSEAADGGKWADLVLAGHTHGGQVRLFDWMPREPSAYGEKYLSGWVQENGHLMLVSNGIGCVYANLRWGAPAQAHLITFRKAPANTPDGL